MRKGDGTLSREMACASGGCSRSRGGRARGPSRSGSGCPGCSRPFTFEASPSRAASTQIPPRRAGHARVGRRRRAADARRAGVAAEVGHVGDAQGRQRAGILATRARRQPASGRRSPSGSSPLRVSGSSGPGCRRGPQGLSRPWWRCAAPRGLSRRRWRGAAQNKRIDLQGLKQ